MKFDMQCVKNIGMEIYNVKVGFSNFYSKKKLLCCLTLFKVIPVITPS